MSWTDKPFRGLPVTVAEGVRTVRYEVIPGEPDGPHFWVIEAIPPEATSWTYPGSQLIQTIYLDDVPEADASDYPVAP